ncbi:hypothetical protein HG530_010579 [Fusarium avenaceum]|nr:hypothetical protein HG530_010579 [Fusarium avenaceum]
MLFNARCLGTKWQVRHANPSREATIKSEPSPRVRFILKRLGVLLLRYVFLCIYYDPSFHLYMPDGIPWKQEDFSPGNQQLFWRFLFSFEDLETQARHLLTRGTFIRLYIVFDQLIPDYLILSSYHDILSIIAIGLRIDTPEEWPPLFGQIGQAYSVRRYWSHFWHLLVYRSFSAHAEYMIIKATGTRKRTEMTRYVNNACVFVLSGLMHALVEWTLSPDSCSRCGCWATFWRYCLQFGAIIVEEVFQNVGQKLECRLIQAQTRYMFVTTLHRVSGYIWVIFWTLWSKELTFFPQHALDPASSTLHLQLSNNLSIQISSQRFYEGEYLILGMSGTEVLFTVGIICNAMQIITFGKDALHVYRSIRDNGAPDPRLESYLDLAATGYKSLRDHSHGPLPLTNDQQQILDLSEKAYKSLQMFQSKFQELQLDMQSRKGLVGSLRAVKAGFKTLFNDKELKDLEKDFRRYEQLLQVHLIQRVCSQSDASALLTQEAFTRLEANQQEVVIKLAEGRTQLCDLVSRESTMIKDHVQNEFASQKQYEDDKKRQQQLLASLRYPEMNARKNQIATNFPNTCHWIFKTARPSRISSPSSTDGDHDDDDSDDSSDNWSEDAASNDQDKTDSTALGNNAGLPENVPEEHTPFARWLMSDSRMFWISGKPASGKSTLMKFIATTRKTRDNLEVWRPSVQILTHYFWKLGSEMEKNLRGMLLSLTHQVLFHQVDLIRSLWERPEISFIHQKWSHADWAFEEIENLLCKTLELSDYAFFIMIDGLDESAEFEKYLSVPDHNPNVLDRFIQLKKVKVCASSREENTFCRHFEGVESLRIHDLTEHDIRRFAKSRLKALNLSKSWHRQYLLDELTLNSHGVFLWALIERVKHAPRDIMELFQDIWERSGKDGDVASYRVTASQYLNLVLAATRLQQDGHSYSISQLPHSFLVVAMASETRDVKSMLDPARRIAVPDFLERCSKVELELPITCCGLLEVNDREINFGTTEVLDSLMHHDKKTIRFVHRCAIDYLTDTESGAALLGACRWSKEEPIARLLGGYMMRGRFLKTGPPRIFFDHIADGRRFFRPTRTYTCLDAVLSFIESGVLSGSSWPEFFIRTSRKWQLAGAFQQQFFWSHPGRSACGTSELEIQFFGYCSP